MPFLELNEDNEELFYEDPPPCHRCDDSGTILVCPDSVCQGTGECMHGDGEITCPVCNWRKRILKKEKPTHETNRDYALDNTKRFM